jgi:CRISPR-associated exonuclease Cas4
VFCPRIPYFVECLGIYPPKPFWVHQGLKYHDLRQRLIRDRTFNRYHLNDAGKHFKYTMKSEDIKLHGICDLVLETASEVCPVEYKIRSSQIYRGWRIQLTAYGMLAECCFRKKCVRGFIISEKPSKTVPVEISTDHREDVLKIKNTLLNLMKNPVMPLSSAEENKCTQCEFLNFCNDRE